MSMIGGHRGQLEIEREYQRASYTWKFNLWKGEGYHQYLDGTQNQLGCCSGADFLNDLVQGCDPHALQCAQCRYMHWSKMSIDPE